MATAHLGEYPPAADIAEPRDVEQSVDDRLPERVLAARVIIEQAKGILMSAHGCNEDVAFDMLVAVSQRSNIKLRDIAAEFVTQVEGHGAERREKRTVVAESLARACRR